MPANELIEEQELWCLFGFLKKKRNREKEAMRKKKRERKRIKDRKRETLKKKNRSPISEGFRRCRFRQPTLLHSGGGFGHPRLVLQRVRRCRWHHQFPMRPLSPCQRLQLRFPLPRHQLSQAQLDPRPSDANVGVSGVTPIPGGRIWSLVTKAVDKWWRRCTFRSTLSETRCTGTWSTCWRRLWSRSRRTRFA